MRRALVLAAPRQVSAAVFCLVILPDLTTLFRMVRPHGAPRLPNQDAMDRALAFRAIQDEQARRWGTERFCNRLAELLLRLAWTPRQCAELFGVSVPTVERWLAGRSEPHPHIAKTVLDALSSALSSASG